MHTAAAMIKLTVMSLLADLLKARFDSGDFVVNDKLDEIMLLVPENRISETMRALRDEKDFCFEQLIDLAGIDYSEHAAYPNKKFAVVYHLLSLTHNRRLRVRAFCEDESFPQMSSVTDIWAAAGWFEREAFDLYGIVFHGHQDLRRILTDYGFIGHPFRKDFPVSGHVEMRYDPEKKRVVYVPVSIEPREVTPRIVREDDFGRERDDHG